MASVFEWASRYVREGLSVIPVRADGSKAPAFQDWRQFTDRIASADELSKWFECGKEYGIGVVPGPASGNLAVLDFEVRNGIAAFDRWKAGLSDKQMSLLAACPVIVTPSGGRHVWVRGHIPHKGGVLAKDAAGMVLIEVRGTGQQVLAPGCPPKCHRSGNPYTFESYGWLPTWN